MVFRKGEDGCCRGAQRAFTATRGARSASVDAAVDIERRAGDETVVLAGEKHGGTRDIIGIAAATERYAVNCCLGGLRSCVRVVKARAEKSCRVRAR